MELANRLTSTKRGTLLVALMAALLAAVSILVYLRGYRQSVKAEGTLVTVLVAKDTIARGTVGSVVASKGLYTVMTMRESQLREGALSDPESLRGMVAAREILRGAQLTTTDFAAGGDSLAGRLTDRERIISVPLDSAHGLIGDLEVGNRVDVYAGFNVVPLRADGTPTTGGEARPMLRLIMSDVAVVRVGDKASGSGTTNVALSVNDVKAAELAFAADNGKIWLVLRPSAGALDSRPGLVTVETMLLGVSPVRVMKSLRGNR